MADALRLLVNIQQQSGLEFAAASIRFLRMIDKVFDQLNSRLPFIFDSKQAITHKGIEVDTVFLEAETELRALRLFHHLLPCDNRLGAPSQHFAEADLLWRHSGRGGRCNHPRCSLCFIRRSTEQPLSPAWSLRRAELHRIGRRLTSQTTDKQCSAQLHSSINTRRKIIF